MAGNMNDSMNDLLQKMLSDWWVSKPAIFHQILYQSIANSGLVWPHPQPYIPRPSSLTSTLPFSASWTSYPVPTFVASPAHSMLFGTLVDHISDEDGGYLFALTNEYSEAFMIDAV